MSFDLKIENGDISIGSDGDLKKVENTDKLIQDMLKILITPSGSNPFFPFYGSPISKSIVGTAMDIEFINRFTSDQVKSSLDILQKLQQAQQHSGQKITPSELLAAISQVKIDRNQTDPRHIRVVIEAIAKDLQPISTFFDIRT